eukprot:TRINITY_DN5251_c0_g1_i4.p1 TRINITY_DN5251_c0_g1~~TRINITY_DN5251_c0_g1_i4.p1  ORF type:complete len:374 (-),score=71.63 TRINITY_DN5251_c0_g1_i4:124-1245(-)
MVFDAVSCLISKDDDDAAFGAHLKLLCNFPKDLVSLKRGQILCFYMGRPDLSLQLVEQVLSSNEGERYIYGMLSFALLEVGRMRDAEFAAKRGLLIKSDDPWSQHALCHVLQYDCRFKEAIDFMEQHSESWNFCCPFMYVHNWWHLALCYVEGDADLNSVLNIYDNRILVSLKRENVDASQVYLNALGLLLTLHVRRHSSIIKDKVKYLADGLVDKSLWHQEWQLDLFVVWAFSYSNKASQAEQCLDGMKRRVTHMRESKSQRFKSVLLLAESLYYYGKSDYHQAYNVLGKGFNVCDCKVMGASNEQLDVFEGARLDILIKSDHISEAIEALENSTSLHGGSTLTRCLLERAYSSINSGDASTKDAATPCEYI